MRCLRGEGGDRSTEVSTGSVPSWREVPRNRCDEGNAALAGCWLWQGSSILKLNEWNLPGERSWIVSGHDHG
jgi:hypothetical protein